MEANIITLYQRPALADYLQVCHEACPDQIEQYEALAGDKFEPDVIATKLFLQDGPAWTIYVDDKPVLVAGFTQIRPGVWQDWLVSNARAWEKDVYVGVSRRVRKVMDAMLKTEAHRLQCISLRSRIQAHEWYRVLGLRQEGVLEAYGVDGQDALMFARVRAE